MASAVLLLAIQCLCDDAAHHMLLGGWSPVVAWFVATAVVLLTMIPWKRCRAHVEPSAELLTGRANGAPRCPFCHGPILARVEAAVGSRGAPMLRRLEWRVDAESEREWLDWIEELRRGPTSSRGRRRPTRQSVVGACACGGSEDARPLEIAALVPVFPVAFVLDTATWLAGIATSPILAWLLTTEEIFGHFMPIADAWPELPGE